MRCRWCLPQLVVSFWPKHQFGQPMDQLKQKYCWCYNLPSEELGTCAVIQRVGRFGSLPHRRFKESRFTNIAFVVQGFGFKTGVMAGDVAGLMTQLHTISRQLQDESARADLAETRAKAANEEIVKLRDGLERSENDAPKECQRRVQQCKADFEAAQWAAQRKAELELAEREARAEKGVHQCFLFSRNIA